MFKIKIADLVVEIDNLHDQIEYICRDYLYKGEHCDFSIVISQKDIDDERERFKDSHLYNDAYIENICIYRQICLNLLRYDAFVMHAAVIGVDDYAYAFTAKSGTGKSTHICLWRQLLGERVYVINGDKPVLRFIDGKLFAYGTPWCGKEMWNTNTRAELKGLCFIERGELNQIDKIEPQEAAPLIMKQILIPNDSFGVIKTFDLVDKMLKDVTSWKLKCTVSVEAAMIAYNAMNGGKNEN